MTVARAMWTSFGLRVDEMTFIEYETKTAMLAAEAEHERRKGEKR